MEITREKNSLQRQVEAPNVEDDEHCTSIPSSPAATSSINSTIIEEEMLHDIQDWCEIEVTSSGNMSTSTHGGNYQKFWS